MKERYLNKTPFLTFVYISKCNINLPGYFGNSKKRFLWTGLVVTESWSKDCLKCTLWGELPPGYISKYLFFILAIGWVRVLKPFSLLILKGENVKWSVTRLCKCEDVDCCTFCRQHDNATLWSGKSEIYPTRKTKLSSYLFDILLFQYGHQFHDLCPNWSELQLQRCEPIINNGLRSLARQTDTYAFGPHLLIYDYHQIWSQIHFLKTWQKLSGIKILSSRRSTVWRQIFNFFFTFLPSNRLGQRE